MKEGKLDPVKREIGRRIQYLRKNHRDNLSQEGEAHRLGVKIDRYAAWEVGRAVPPVKILIALADRYKVTLDYLLAGRKEKALREPLPPRIESMAYDLAEMPEEDRRECERLIEAKKTNWKRNRIHDLY